MSNKFVGTKITRTVNFNVQINNAESNFDIERIMQTAIFQMIDGLKRPIIFKRKYKKSEVKSKESDVNTGSKNYFEAYRVNSGT